MEHNEFDWRYETGCCCIQGQIRINISEILTQRMRRAVALLVFSVVTKLLICVDLQTIHYLKKLGMLLEIIMLIDRSGKTLLHIMLKEETKSALPSATIC